MDDMLPEVVDSTHFRRVLGQYPTGVVVVTGMHPDGWALGMTVGSFTSVSLDPPLVAFLPDRKSSSWKDLRAASTRFCINVLAATQEDISRAIATRKTNKFDGIEWTPSALGNPMIEGAVAYIDCTLEQIYEAGDHDIVIGRVHELDTGTPEHPLLFFQGGYGSFRPRSLAARDADLLDQLTSVDVARAIMEKLAADFDTEVTVHCMVNDELVLAASAGQNANPRASRVGTRWAHVPPMGSVHAAFGPDEVRERWIARVSSVLTPKEAARQRRVPDLVRERGYAVTFGHEHSEALARATTRASQKDPTLPDQELLDLARAASACFNPDSLDDRSMYELRYLSAPVFDHAGELAFAMTLWGPAGEVDRSVVDRYTTSLLESSRAATVRLAAAAPMSSARSD